jgi:hypothetical protein
MSPAITENLLAAVYVALSIVGAGETHARPKQDFTVHPRCTVNFYKIKKRAAPFIFQLATHTTPATLTASQAGSQDT